MTVWLGFVSGALLWLLIWLILLFRSTPKSSCDPFGWFFANCLIWPSNLGLIMSLLNMLVSLVACPRNARASITDVGNSLLTSIFYLLNHPMTFSQVSVIAYAAETFNDWIFRRLMLVIGFAVRRFSFQISLFILGALRWGQFSGLSYFLFKILNFSSSKPLRRT